MMVNRGRTIDDFPGRGKQKAAAPAAMDFTSFLRDIPRPAFRVIFNNFIWLKTFSCYTVQQS